MNGAWVTFKKELLSYVVSPVGWIIAVVFYLWRGYEMAVEAERFSFFRLDQDLFTARSYGLNSTFLMVLLVPGVLTMRCFAEERRTGSIETLMTAPVRDGAIVAGKWAAAVAFFCLLWLPSVVVLHVLEYGPFFAADLSFGPVFAAYLGMFLLSGMLLAFGCLASSLTDNLLLAALLAIVFDFALLSLPRQVAESVPDLADRYYLREILDKFNVAQNFSDWFARGLIDTSQVAFYVGGTLFFLFLTGVSLTSRRVA